MIHAVGDRVDGLGDLLFDYSKFILSDISLGTALAVMCFGAQFWMLIYTMASVSWQYPQDQLIVLRRQTARAAETQAVVGGVDMAPTCKDFQASRTWSTITGQRFKAAALSALLGIGTELSTDDESDIARAIRARAQGSASVANSTSSRP